MLYEVITLAPEKVDGFINSMLRQNDEQGFLPIWALWGKETFCMIGNHAVPVVVDAYLKGFSGFDAERAFQAVKTSLTTDHQKSSWEIRITSYNVCYTKLLRFISLPSIIPICFCACCLWSKKSKNFGR